MAWKETYHCDVCGKPKAAEDPDWWLSWDEAIAPAPGDPQQPVMKLTPWNLLLSHSAGMKHLCGAACIQTQMDRWVSAYQSQPE